MAKEIYDPYGINNPNYNPSAAPGTAGSLAPDAPISSASLTPASPIQVPPAPTPTLPNTGGADATTKANQSFFDQAIKDQTEADPNSLEAQIKGLLKTPSKTDTNKSLYESTYGISPETARTRQATAQTDYNASLKAYQDAQDRYNALNAQIQGLDYQQNTVIPNQTQQEATGRGITAAGLAPITAAKQREVLLQKAPIQYQALLAQAEVASALGKGKLAEGILNQANAHIDSLYEARKTDLANTVKHQEDTIDKAWSYFTEKEKTKAADIKSQTTANATQANKYIDDVQAAIKEAASNGNAVLAGNIAKLISTPLDPTSKTFAKDYQNANTALATLQGQIQSKDLQFVSGTENQPAGYFNKQTGVFTPIGGGGGTGGKTTMQLAQVKAKVDQLSALTNQSGLGSAVGTSFITRAPSGFFGTLGALVSVVGAPSAIMGTFNKLTGAQQNFIGDVEQLRSQLNLDALIGAKAQGATFGALSDQELRVLASSATKLGTWVLKDKDGNTIGYNTSETNFKKEIDKINNFAKLDYIIKGGDPADVNAKLMPDGSLWTTNSDGTFTQIK